MKLLPGVLLATLLALMAWGVQLLEIKWAGQAVVEALVVAILLGMLWRNLIGVSERQKSGISFTAKYPLEIAIVLLGGAMDFGKLLAGGPKLLAAACILVVCGLFVSRLIGRLAGLERKVSTLVAVGNSICGNSAIAAIAPVIGATAAEVAGAIAFTAVLGVGVVLTLPLLIPLFDLSHSQYGVLAGLTVYAVPQVLAATAPVSTLSGDVGTLVKLIRVLLLGPVALFYSLRTRRTESEPQPFSARSLFQFIPWFITGFVLLALVRSAGLIPAQIVPILRDISKTLTLAAMAALGLGVDLGALKKTGPRIALVVTGSLLFLIALALLLIKLLGIE